MNERFKPLFLFADPEDTSYLRLLRGILTIAGVGLLVLMAALRLTQPENTTALLILAVMEAAVLLSFVLLNRKIYWLAQLLIPLLTIGGVTTIANLSNGMHDTSMAGFPAAIILGGLILGKQAIPLVTLLTLMGVSIVAYRDMTGLNTTFMAVKTGFDDLAVFSTIQIIIAASLNALMTRLYDALKKSRENEQAQLQANQELRQLKESLEDQVTQRTRELSERSAELEQANLRAGRRAAQFQAIAETSRAVASIRSLKELLPRIVNVVSAQFGFYHVGIFLVDEASQFAVLSAASSEGGQRMLARGHRLEVGGKSIVGYVTGLGQPRIALNTGADAVFFNNPDLPETRSEMALPLVAEKRVIGALDVQSKQPNAFTQDDIEVLSALADQIGIAIETARLFEKSAKALAEAETLSRQYAQRAWSRAGSSGEVLGYRYTVSGAEPLQAPELLAAPKEVNIETGENATLTLPIQLRGEAIGLLNIRVPRKEFWRQDELKIVQAVAERVAIAADNARLYEESQRRAEKERTLGIISEKLSKEVNLENIFRTALQELGQLVPGSEVFIAFETDQPA